MLQQEMVYSEERDSWNLIVDGEWYLEGTYEQCEEAMFNNAVDDYYEDDYSGYDEY